MKDTIEKAIKLLASEIKTGVSADAALKFTQAALNLAHVLQVQVQTNSNAAPN